VVKIPDNVRNAEELNRLGVEVAQKGNIKEALNYFTRALKEDPENSRAIENIGNCRQAMGDRNGACLEWKKAAAKGSKYAIEMVAKYCK
jgi:tetratricopeptide (TPR) repeat protein